MNDKDKQNLDLVLQRLKQQDQDRRDWELRISERIGDLKKTEEKHHGEVTKGLHLIKIELFDPHKGLWFETKKNSFFRKTVTRFAWIIIPLAVTGTVMLIIQIISWLTPPAAVGLSP